MWSLSFINNAFLCNCDSFWAKSLNQLHSRQIYFNLEIVILKYFRSSLQFHTLWMTLYVKRCSIFRKIFLKFGIAFKYDVIQWIPDKWIHSQSAWNVVLKLILKCIDSGYAFSLVCTKKKAADMFAASKGWIRFMKIYLNSIVKS